MAEWGTEAQALAAKLKPIRQKRWSTLRGIVRDDNHEEPDFVCDRCLNEYCERDKEFTPRCFLTSDVQIREKQDEMWDFDEDEVNQWWILNDPVMWAEYYLNWTPRWYQLEPIRCTARKKVFRMGRQIGKTEVLTILALFYVCTRPNFRTIIVCPYQDQVDLIFKRIRAFIQRSDILNDREFKLTDRQNPHEIEFYHAEGNSSIMGITAGAKTGGKGDKFRGQTPDMLIMDEGDMLNDETMESILASLTGKGKIAQMIVSSTPTGRRGQFWKYCTNKKIDFKEFKFTSMVSPNWDEEIELFYRESYSENGFAHEFLAEFGEMEIGLFQHRFIEASMEDYSISREAAHPEPGWIYTFGVDWNRRKIGVHIVVTGYNYMTEKFKMVYKEVVSAAQFTQHLAIRRIEELSEIWKPEYIYVDEGDGTTQVEALQLHGLAKPSTRLHKTVKPVEFGSTTMIRDPLTKAFVKKSTKQLMVELCVRRFETMRCIVPACEDTQAGLVGQMREFAIVKWSSKGTPKYTDDTEHTLIAWMLSVFAVIMELSDIAKNSSATTIALTGQFGEQPKIPMERDQEREVRIRKERLEPKVRAFPSNGGRFGTRTTTIGDQTGQSVRSRSAHAVRTAVGSIKRPTWSR
jgi:replicative DNA helicase